MRLLKRVRLMTDAQAMPGAIWLVLRPLATACLLLLFLAVLTHADDSVPLNPLPAWISYDSDTTTSVAWGDVDGDGDLDLAAGNDGPNKVYLNQGGTLQTTAAWISSDSDQTTSVAWGDVDGDGDLDLAAGNGGPNKVYLNQGGTLQTTAAWISSDSDQTASVAWGDVDGDGDLDLAVGNEPSWEGNDGANKVYLNQEGALQTTAAWISSDSDWTTSVAWGDVDGDGDLDLAVGDFTSWEGRGGPKVYLNQQGTLQTVAGWAPDPFDHTTSVAWGDVDGDGDLDLAVGNGEGLMFEPLRLYLNQGGVLETTASWSSADWDWATSIAWGDADSDGDLDLAVGTGEVYQQGVYSSARIMVYLNQAGTLQTTSAWAFDESDHVTSVAWGDVDGDNDLDLAVGGRENNKLYLNEGSPLRIAWNAEWLVMDASSVAWGDVDGDDDLDLAIGASMEWPNTVCLNQTGVLQTTDPWRSNDSDWTTSVAWGDMDGDGDLDLAVGNEPPWEGGGENKVYVNDGHALQTTAAWISDDGDRTTSVAWGDVDGDGDLDLAAGNDGQNKVYTNQAGTLQTTAAWISNDNDATTSVAWGDVDGDGDLDLAAGNSGQNKVYQNQAGTLQATAAWISDDSDVTTSIAWGDVDGDSDLDLAVGNRHVPNKVYFNKAGALQPSAAWVSHEYDDTYSLAWGDMDGDGYLDLAVANSDFPMSRDTARVYLNQAGILQTTAAWTDYGSLTIAKSVAWGDINKDGHLDLVIANYDEHSAGGLIVYQNHSPAHVLHLLQSPYLAIDLGGDTVQTFGQQTSRALAPANFYAVPGIRQTGTIPITYTLFDATGTPMQSVQGSYSPDGGGRWYPAVASGDTITANLTTAPTYTIDPAEFGWIDIASTGTSVTLGDEQVAGPFNLGFGFPFFNQAVSQFWISSNGWLSFAAPGDPEWSNDCLPSSTAPANLIAPFWDDLNPGAGGQVYYQQIDDSTLVVEFHQVPHYDGGGPYTFEAILQRDGSITFQYQNIDPPLDSATIGFQNRGGSKALQLACNSTYAEDNLAVRANRTGQRHTYTWDVLASGFFGQSDNVVFRLKAYSISSHSSAAGTYHYTNTIPGPYQQRPYVVDHTFPFRVRGTQVRVISGTVPASRATVYRRPAGQTAAYRPYQDRAGHPSRTDAHGYLQGRGELQIGDRLVALAPITHTDTYTLYHTSAAPTDTGLDAYTVMASGVQTLTVSSANALVLFNLDIALEWDASKDEQFMSQLRFDLQRTSELLFDWSNGQAALGRLRIFHDARHVPATDDWQPWLDSHIRIYASNRLRPNAAQGGMVSEITTDTMHSDIVYAPGQVRMGAVWNRYGEATGSLGEDWPRTLAHELGHYGFFLDDNYLGLDDDGLLIPVDTCPGAMSDPYREDYSEFHPHAGWLPGCKQTLSNQLTGRSDWETINLFYSAFHPPAGAFDDVLTGPSSLPLAVTQIEVFTNTTTTEPLDVPIFYLSQDGHSVQTGPRARAFLFQGDPFGAAQDEWLTDLGRPAFGEVHARGAREGDRLCVFELSEERLGCQSITAGTERLELVSVPNWQPDVIVSPVTSRTIAISVTNVPAGLLLGARLFPVNDPAPDCILLDEPTPGQYAGIFLPQDEPVLDGFVHVWVEADSDPESCSEPVDHAGQEIVTEYTMGGHPGFARGRSGFARGRSGFARGRSAPVTSADGQMILFGKDLDFEEGQFYTVQSATTLPDVPAWATVVGQGYWLTASPHAPDLSDTSISFSYLGSEVPPGEEGWLRMYFWDGVSWKQLPTTLDTYQNMAAAPTQGPGLYVLMSSIEIPLYGPGWNIFAYPVQETRPVTEALLSISGTYTTVYGYEPRDKTDPWKVYDVTVPDWVNDLYVLEFGRGYWINVSETITLLLKGASASGLAADSSLQSPPATYYGAVLPGPDFTPVAGMMVTAWIEDHLCGQGQTLEVVGQVVYTINVHADGPGDAIGCGTLGRLVTFEVGSHVMQPTVGWDNGQVWEVSLSAASQQRFHLPLIIG